MAEVTSGKDLTVIVLNDREVADLLAILNRFVDCIDPTSVDVRNAYEFLGAMGVEIPQDNWL